MVGGSHAFVLKEIYILSEGQEKENSKAIISSEEKRAKNRQLFIVWF